MKKFGIDISVWQKGINLSKAKNEGVKFAILRGMYGNEKDTEFETYYKNAKAIGLDVGVYQWGRAANVAQAREEAQNVLQEAKDFADETIRIINKQTSGGNISRALEKERAKLRGKLDDVNTKLNKQTESKPKKALKPKELKIGDAVKVLSMNLKGTVSTLPNAKGDFFVQMGILRSQVNIKDVEKIEEQTITGPGTSMQKSSTSKIKMNKSSYVSPEVNLIGMTVDEALSVLDKYLDDAYLAHIPQVRIVHGRGTGALRNGVHNHLRRLKYVKSFRLGSFGEGDTGVTIVEFK